jgi:hypothetical protein
MGQIRLAKGYASDMILAARHRINGKRSFFSLTAIRHPEPAASKPAAAPLLANASRTLPYDNLHAYGARVGQTTHWMPKRIWTHGEFGGGLLTERDCDDAPPAQGWRRARCRTLPDHFWGSMQLVVHLTSTDATPERMHAGRAKSAQH